LGRMPGDDSVNSSVAITPKREERASYRRALAQIPQNGKNIVE